MKNEVASNYMHDQAIDVFSRYIKNEGYDRLQKNNIWMSTNNIF